MRLIPLLAAIVAGTMAGIPAVLDAQTSRSPIFVGPQLREGFLDVDSGIRDSIRDINRELVGSEFKQVQNRDEATIVLLVLGRGIVTAGSIGVGSSSGGIGSMFVVPYEKPTISTLLRVGTYQRTMQSEGDTWTGAAQRVIRDLDAWWEVNAAAVRARGK
jgi:hypothetical protein